MAGGTFISYLPVVSGATIPVTVVESDISHAAAWDRDVQLPWIDGTDRIDAKWRWCTLYQRCALIEAFAERHLAYLRIVTSGAQGQVFTVGQVLLSDGYPYPRDWRKPCVFLWWLAGAPSGAAAQAGVPVCRGVTEALVDVALQFSYIRGYGGRLCLHASPSGTKAQRAKLMKTYKRVGLKRWNEGLFVGLLRLNDGRYFFADESLAATLTRKLDGYR